MTKIEDDIDRLEVLTESIKNTLGLSNLRESEHDGKHHIIIEADNGYNWPFPDVITAQSFVNGWMFRSIYDRIKLDSKESTKPVGTT